MIEKGAAVIDVRRAEEWDEGRIGGSTRIELAELGDRTDEVPNDRAVIFVCTVGKRSALASEAFRASGHDAYNLAGGLEAWTGEGLPLEK